METVAIIIITSALFLTFEKFNSIIPLIPAAYLLIDKKLRHLSWEDIGFNIKATPTNVRENWNWLALVGIVSPILTFYMGKLFIPGYINHVKARLPIQVGDIVPTLITVAIGTFLEEVIFRGFVQGRLEGFIGTFKAILIAALLFSFMHYSTGNITIVIIDMLGIFIDGILLGIIFTKTKNIFTCSVGHCLSDLIGIVCLLFFV